jgi:hypothetical protein
VEEVEVKGYEMGLLTKAQILEAQDLQVEDVEVPEWGGTVRVQGMSGAERNRLEQSWAGMSKNGGELSEQAWGNIYARLTAICAVDEQGERLFTSKDVEALGQKSALALQRVALAAMRVSGLSQEAVEDIAKN